MSTGETLLARPRASFWARFGAIFIDGFVLVIPYLVLWALLGETNGGLVSIGVDAAYFASLNGMGQTLGKRVLGIRVVDARTGEAIGFGRGVLRYVVSIVSYLALLIGYLWMIWDREKQTWHDKAARSVVVRLT